MVTDIRILSELSIFNSLHRNWSEIQLFLLCAFPIISDANCWNCSIPIKYQYQWVFTLLVVVRLLVLKVKVWDILSTSTMSSSIRPEPTTFRYSLLHNHTGTRSIVLVESAIFHPHQSILVLLQKITASACDLQSIFPDRSGVYMQCKEKKCLQPIKTLLRFYCNHPFCFID